MPVDGFDLVAHVVAEAVLGSDRFELTVHRRPAPGHRPPIALNATWDGRPDPVVLARLEER